MQSMHLLTSDLSKVITYCSLLYFIAFSSISLSMGCINEYRKHVRDLYRYSITKDTSFISKSWHFACYNRKRNETDQEVRMRFRNFLIVVKDIEKAKQFYHDLFGFEVLVDFDGRRRSTGRSSFRGM